MPTTTRKTLWAQEQWIDRTRNIGMGDSDVYETFATTPGELYKAMQREYGRCTSRVYIDRDDATPQAIGWTFVKRRKYTDTRESYLAETWVTVHTGPPTRSTTFAYADLGGAA